MPSSCPKLDAKIILFIIFRYLKDFVSNYDDYGMTLFRHFLSHKKAIQNIHLTTGYFLLVFKGAGMID